MNTNLKDKIKMCLAVGSLAIIIIMVFIIVVQYQVEGEKNMPYTLSKITIISTKIPIVLKTFFLFIPFPLSL